MQTFISDLIPKIQRFSQKSDDLTLLTNQHWVVIEEIDQHKNVYIFRKNNELLISSNGIVEKGRWEYLGNNSLLIDKKDKSYLFKHGFFDENILALKIDGKNEYAFLINENRYYGELDTMPKVLDFLSRTYLHPTVEKQIGQQYDLPKKLVVGEKTPEEIECEREELRKFQARNSKIIFYSIIVILAVILISQMIK